MSATGCFRRFMHNGVHAQAAVEADASASDVPALPALPLSVAEDMYARCVNLPSSPFLAA